MIGKNMLSAFSDRAPAPEKPAEVKTETTEDSKPNTTETAQEPEKVEDQEPTAYSKPDSKTEPAQEPKEPVSEDDSLEGKSNEPANEPEPESEPESETQANEIDDEAVLKYFKEKRGKELETLDDLFKEPEPAKDPYEGLSEEAAQFVKYNKETGRSYDDFKALNRDYTKTNPLEIAREKAISMSDGYLDRSNVDEYLQEEFNMDVTDFDSLTPVEKMKLKNFGSDYIKTQLELKEKYKQPIERGDQTEMVTLENGQQMPKETYNKLLDQQQQYQKSIKEASDKITASAYDIKIDDNGTEKVMNVGYEYSKEEVRDMASSALNIDDFYQKAFGGEKGLDYVKLQEGLHWANPAKREKSITAIVHKALAQQAEEFAALEHNAGVKTKSMPKDGNSKSKASITDWRGGQKQGIPFSPDQF